MSGRGSPRGTIHIYNADGVSPGPSKKEIEGKQDNRGSIEDELEGTQDLNRSRAADTFYKRNMHPYIDISPRDESKHIFIVYPEMVDNRAIDGHFFVVMDDLGLKARPAFDFWGSAYDFIDALVHAIPELDSVVLNLCKNKIPSTIIKVIQHELWKKGIDVFSGSPINNHLGKIEPEMPPKDEITVESLAKAIEDPSMRSKMQDPYHKLRGLKLSRVLRIAWHIIQTPADEVEGPEDRWSLVPDKPSEANEKEAIEKFKSRDEAAARLNDLKAEVELGERKEEEPIEEEPIEEEEAINASAEKSANVMHDWLDPEEASRVAWSLRKK